MEAHHAAETETGSQLRGLPMHARQPICLGKPANSPWKTCEFAWENLRIRLGKPANSQAKASGFACEISDFYRRIRREKEWRNGKRNAKGKSFRIRIRGCQLSIETYCIDHQCSALTNMVNQINSRNLLFHLYWHLLP